MGSLKRKNAPDSRTTAKPTKVAPDESPPSKRARPTTASEPVVPPPVVSRLKEEEPLFPRGGGSVLSPLEHKSIQLQAKKDVLFESETISSKKKSDKPPQKKSKARALTRGLVRDDHSVKIEGLNFQRLVKGSLVLGQVSEINPLEIVLSLPNNLSGHVSIASVSELTTSKLESASMDDGEKSNDEVDDDGGVDLHALFSVGQYLRAYVTSTVDESASSSSTAWKSKRRVELSLYPEHANFGLSDADIVQNCTVAGSILSIEDHGYVVSLGIADSELRGFLPRKEVADLGDSRPGSADRLPLGCVRLFLVTGKGLNGKVAQVSLLPEKLGSLENYPAKARTISSFLPGTAVDVLVSEASQHRLAGKVLGHLDVTADIIHSGSGPDGAELETKLKVGTRVKARVICTFPTSRSPKLGVSLLDHVAALKPRLATIHGQSAHPLTALPSSSTVESCVVRGVEPDIGLFVDLGVAGVPGFVHISRVKDGKVEALSGSAGPYRVGSVHRGRVIGYNAMDGIFLVSLEKSVLERRYLRIEDVPVGDVVSATVEKLVVGEHGVSGLIVKLAEGVTGFVPEMHLADVRLQHPEKKFRKGSDVKARVLSSDPAKRQLRLTLKRTLVNSEAKPLRDLSEATMGMAVPGTIVKINPIGAFVQFYGSLRGFLPVSQMSEAYIHDPNEHFRVGQVVNVHVVEVDPERRRLVVSCKDPSAFGMEKQLALQKLKLGDVVTARVVQKTEDDVYLELTDGSLKAVLPADHLTDKAPLRSRAVLRKIRVGQTVDELVVLEKDERRRAIQLSQKPSLVKASRNGQLLTAIADAKVGAVAWGFVRNVTATAMFVRFAGELTALVPKSLMPQRMQAQAKEGFGVHAHQSVRVKIHSVDGNRLVASVLANNIEDDDDARIEATISGGETAGEQPGDNVRPGGVGPDLDQPLKNAVDPTLGSPADIMLGRVTRARVVSVKRTQLNVALADNVQGRVDVSEVFDSWDEMAAGSSEPLQQFEVNQVLDVRVIGVHDAHDHRFLPFSHRSSRSVFELSAKPSCLDSRPYRPLALADVKPGSSWLAFVNNVEGNRWLWVNLSPTLRGRIRAGEVSDNSALGRDLASNFPVGSALRVRVLAADLDSGRLDLSARSALPKEAEGGMSWDDVEQDAVLHARVTKVTDRQVMLQLSKSVSGPLHLIDLCDDYDQADPHRFSGNDVVRVAVVSVDRSNKKLRLSARESRVMSSALPVRDREVTSAAQLEPGAVVRGFVKNVSDKGLFVALGGDVTALVRIADLSDRYLKEWKDHFQVDQLVRGRVLAVEQAAGRVQLSLKASVVDEDFVPLAGFCDFTAGQVVTGKVRKVADFGAFIAIDGSANVSGLCHRSEMADRPVKDATKLYKEGDAVKALVLDVDVEKRRISLGLKPAYFDGGVRIGSDDSHDDDDEHDKDEDDENEGAGGATLGSVGPDSGEYDNDEAEDHDMQDADSVVLVTRTPDESEDDRGDAGNSEDETIADAEARTGGGGKVLALAAGAFSWSAGSLLDDDAGMAEDSGAEGGGGRERGGGGVVVDRKEARSRKRRKLDIEVDRTGQLDAHGPQTASDFERLLLGQPNSSSLWISYMAFQMQVSELTKAREVAERAVNTINVREETEKLNLWIAYLNLEAAYGTDETLAAVFSRACEYNDEQEVHERLASICIQSGKHDKAEELFQVMLKKFGSRSPQVWLNYAHFLYTAAGSAERGRALLPRALKIVAGHAHLSLTAKFAGLEFRCGEPERGRTVFEGLLATYPRKFDLWNQLLDLEIAVAKANDPAIIRDVFERGTRVGGLKPRQAKAWFQRWAKWEEENGDTVSRDRVSAKAKEWASLALARRSGSATAI